MSKGLLFATVTSLIAIGIVPSVIQARDLTFEDRVHAQKAIEQVYWNHRIWPKENPGPKPPLSAVMPDETIRAKVEDYLEKSNALETFWQRPIGIEQLQAEIDRIAAGSRDRSTLGEVFEALDRDPYVVAETLARGTLADRLVRDWYARDPRFHAQVRQRAEDDLATLRSSEDLARSSGEYAETTWTLGRDGDNGARGAPAIAIERNEWNERLRSAPEPVGAVSALQEDRGGFFATTVLSKSAESLTMGIVRWKKRPFDAWWMEQRATLRAAAASARGDYSLPELTSSACVPDTWKPTGAPVPAARLGHAAVWTGTEMLVSGGGTNAGFGLEYGDGGRYTPATDSWTSLEGAHAAIGAQAVWTGTEMIVWGGVCCAGMQLNSGARFDPATGAWSPISAGANAPSARSGATVIWTGTRMIVWGGDSPSTGARYDPSTDSWTPTSTGVNVPSPRAGHSAVWSGTEMIVWGGITSGGAYLQTGGRYSPSTDTWLPTSASGNVPTARSSHSAVWTGSQMIVWGGGDFSAGGSGYVNTGASYSPASDSWVTTSIGANVPTRRGSHTAFWTGTEMIVWGGIAPGWAHLQTGGRYSPSTDSWLPTSTGANVPTARSWYSAVWAGTEMILWGGSVDGGSETNTGARYAPSSDTWVPTSMDPRPYARYSYPAVWTGNEVVIWGGRDANGPMEDAERYVPATNSWIWTPTSSQSPKVAGHTLVWSGTEAIFWGGVSTSGSALNTGGRYNPTTDSLAYTSVGAGVPAARSEHTAVWTGTEMIVWGGLLTGGTQLNSGARYSPATNTWTGTSTGANVPSGRWRHSAVWTGNEMIVWGGVGSTFFGNGARYRPATNTWIPTSISGFIDSRHDHSAVWTGSEMIVWGGETSFIGQSIIGGRYRPSTDSWTAMATVGAPSGGRIRHSTVWTGSEMIVWGGASPGEYGTGHEFATGARYSPSLDAWQPTSAAGPIAPGRADHTAVWIGNEMLVWGGRNAAGESHSGARYCVAECADPAVWYGDADGDGFGLGSVEITACTRPPSYAAQAGDCDDANGSISPGAAETCNGLDDNCNGQIDEDAQGADSDGDGIRNACDNCRLTANPSQLDTDGDRLGNACDNCPVDYNPPQSDTNHDGEGDVCDTNDGLIFEFRDDKVSVSWQAEQGPATWNLYIGDLDVTRETGEYTQVPGSNALAARHCAQTSTSADDPGVPAPGKVSFSLVTGVTNGVEGPLGPSSSGPRTNANPCP